MITGGDLRFMLLALLPLSALPAVQSHASAPRTVTVDRGVDDPAISPDGRTIAVSILGKLWLVPASGGEATQVTFGVSWDAHPAWSPDGRFLAYARHMASATELVLYNPATGSSRMLWRGIPEVEGPNEGPSGRQMLNEIVFRPGKPEILFHVEGVQSKPDEAGVYSVPMNGDKPALRLKGSAPPFGGWTFDVSPDGKRLVFVDQEADSKIDLYTFELDSKAVMRLTRSKDAEEFEVHWLPDGKHIVYVERDNGAENILVRPMPDGPVRKLWNESQVRNYEGRQLAPFPDGKALAMVAGRQLHRVDLTTGAITPIPFRARFQLPSLPPADLIITNARLYDGTGRGAVDGATVEIRDGRIARIGTGKPSAARAGAPTIDAQGRFLMAGMFDNHFHTFYNRAFVLTNLTMQGITGLRDTGGQIIESLTLRDAVELGLIDGPDMLITSPVINEEPSICGRGGAIGIRTPEAAPAFVRALKALGVDGIKAYGGITPAVLRSLMIEARTQNLPVTGDLNATHWEEAVDARIDGLNHICNYRTLFKPSSGEVKGLPDPDWDRLDALFRRMAAQGVMLDPTLDACYPFDQGKRSEALLQEMLRRVHRAGVKLLAGSHGTPPLVEEMIGYEAAGIPNEVILEAATLNGPKWFGKDKEMGTVEAGKLANLILVDGNPLARIADLRNVALVVKRGRIVFQK